MISRKWNLFKKVGSHYESLTRFFQNNVPGCLVLLLFSQFGKQISSASSHTICAQLRTYILSSKLLAILITVP